MKIIEVNNGIFQVENKFQNDIRGGFCKYFKGSLIEEIMANKQFNECYYSKSNANVIRGMHFQSPPHDHWKLITLIQGEILDVIIDIRQGSSYGQVTNFEMNSKSDFSILLSPGLAHGFLSKTDNTILNYLVSSEYNSLHDKGIHWDGFGFDWAVVNPIISERDQKFQNFKDFNTPFL